jgi:hypothetical protein
MPARRREPDSPPRRKKGRAKRNRWLLPVLAIGLPLLLMIVGGVLGYFFLAGPGGGDREELLNRLEGEWHADDPEYDGIFFRLHFTDHFVYQSATNSNTGVHLSETFNYEVVSHGRERLVIRTISRQRPEQTIAWTFDFKNDNEVVRSVTKRKTHKHVFQRLGTKLAPREEREKLAARNKEWLVGKWYSHAGAHERYKSITTYFGQDGTFWVVLTFLDLGKPEREEKYTGRYRVNWADGDRLRMVIEGCEELTRRVEVEFKSQDQLVLKLSNYKNRGDDHPETLRRVK